MHQATSADDGAPLLAAPAPPPRRAAAPVDVGGRGTRAFLADFATLLRASGLVHTAGRHRALAAACVAGQAAR
jgi:hypothetical protein